MEEQAKNEIIEKFENIIFNELDNLNGEDKEKKFIKGDVLFNMHKILSNYDELEPVLMKFFAEKNRKEKFEER